jgi:hypothetical protein
MMGALTLGNVARKRDKGPKNQRTKNQIHLVLPQFGSLVLWFFGVFPTTGPAAFSLARPAIPTILS